MSDASSLEPVVGLDRNEQGVVTLTMNRPRFNLLDLQMLSELRTQLGAAAASDASAIVLTGAHSCFCAGLDTRALGEYEADQRRQVIELLNVFVRDLYAAPVPTVAAVPGHALAGGLIFALACDRRMVTSGKCKLGLPEVQAGVPYPAVPLLIVQAELEPGLRRRLALSGDPLTAEQAVACGMFDRQVAQDELLASACVEAASLAAHPAYARIKSQLRADVCARADEIIDSASDPMLKSWL